MEEAEKEKSCSFVVTEEIETSSSRAITTIKYVIYCIISTSGAAISWGHKHGCLVKLIDSFLVITTFCNDPLKIAPIGTEFSPYRQKFESFGQVLVNSCSRLVQNGVSSASFAQILFDFVDRSLGKDTVSFSGI